MQPKHFATALENLIQQQESYPAEAFHFLKEALDFTVDKDDKRDPASRSKHVSASDLLIGFHDLALQEFGPMAATLLSEWGITSCSDVGDMVFLLIEEGMFGKQDSDDREDFAEIYNFDDAFVQPFLPKRSVSA